MTNLIVLMSAVLVAFLVMSTSSTKQTERPLTSTTAPKPQLTVCGKNIYDNPHSKVVGGRKVDKPGKFPWMVAILGNEFGILKQVCGGAIISERHILTASHCFEKWWKPSDLMVRLGDSNMNRTHASPSRRDVAVSKIFMHEIFDENTIFNDIAILQLKEKMDWNKMIRPICLPTAGAALNLEGKMATVAGWGHESENATEGSDFLMEVDLPFIEFSQCKKAYSEPSGPGIDKMTIVKEQICAGYRDGGKDSCQGDSGGPLMFRMNHTTPWTALGIVSYGYPGCARKGVPGVYTRVESHLDWIQSKMAIE